VVFVAGAVAVSAMILPGVSGSLLLVVLGQYEYMSGTVSRFVDGLVALALGNGTNALSETVPSVVTFLAGGVLGVFTIAHAVKYALSRARAATLAFLVSLIVGALRAPSSRCRSGSRRAVSRGGRRPPVRARRDRRCGARARARPAFCDDRVLTRADGVRGACVFSASFPIDRCPLSDARNG